MISAMPITLEDVKAAVDLIDLDVQAAHLKMSPSTRALFPKSTSAPREAAVLVLLFPEAGQLHLVLTRRNENLRGHSGQISFPGGRRDPEDPSFIDTALRETCEELAVCPDDVTVIGQLSQIYIPPSNFNVYPTVGYTAARPAIHPNPDEVAEVFTITLDDLIDDEFKQEEERLIQDSNYLIPYYSFHGHKVWGATAIMLCEFETRLRHVRGLE